MDALEAQYQHILDRASTTGEVRRLDIPRDGIRLAVRVTIDEQIRAITLTIARKGRRVGMGEETKYRKLCKVPANATRSPVQTSEQERRVEPDTEWFLIGYKWAEAMPTT